MSDSKEFAVVGQAPGSQAPHDHPPLCGGRTGRRLVRLFGYDDRMNGLVGYVKLRERALVVNVLDEYPGGEGKGDAFPISDAEKRADDLKSEFGDRGVDTVFLMGKNVARAFGCPTDYLTPRTFGDRTWHVLPHPSPVNRRWNEDRFEERVRAYVLDHVADPVTIQ